MIQLLNGILNLIVAVFEGLFSGLSDIAVSLVKSNRREQFNSDFMPAGKELSSNETGFCLTGNLSLTKHNSFSNAIAFASSGGGKSSCVLIPSILKMTDSSLIVNDPSKELLLKTVSAKIAQGYTVKVLNYTDPLYSERFNPLRRITTISQVKKMSKLLITASLGNANKDKFWDLAAENLLTIFIRFTIFHSLPEKHTLYNVLQLLETFSGTPESVDALFVSIKIKDEELFAQYKSTVGTEGKMLSSIVATAKTALSIFADPEVAEVTSDDTIAFEEYRNKRVILYINNNVQDLKYYSAITAIFFEQFFGFLMHQLPEKKDLPIFFLVDEASSLYLQNLPVVISNIRKYNSGLLFLYQSQHQLMDMYGVSAARNIITNCFARVYFPNQPPEVCRELEALGGKYEFTDEENIKRVRQLITMDEIRIMKNEAIILCGNSPLIKAKLVPYYEQRKLLAQTELPVYEPPEISTSEESIKETLDEEE